MKNKPRQRGWCLYDQPSLISCHILLETYIVTPWYRQSRAHQNQRILICLLVLISDRRPQWKIPETARSVFGWSTVAYFWSSCLKHIVIVILWIGIYPGEAFFIRMQEHRIKNDFFMSRFKSGQKKDYLSRIVYKSLQLQNSGQCMV